MQKVGRFMGWSMYATYLPLIKEFSDRCADTTALVECYAL